MSNNRTLQNAIRSIISIPQQITDYISGAVSRIFSPVEDDYPEIGVQPFEGDPEDK